MLLISLNVNRQSYSFNFNNNPDWSSPSSGQRRVWLLYVRGEEGDILQCCKAAELNRQLRLQLIQLTVIKNIMYSGGNNRRFEPTVSLTLKDGPTSSSSCAQWFRKYRKYILVSLVTGMILFLSLTLGLTLTNATIITSNTPKITTTTMSNTNTVTPTTMPSNTATTTTSTTATTKTTITPGRKRTKFRI